MTSKRPANPNQRWTITKSAAVLHKQVLQPAGYDRHGTTCSRTDFLLRGVTFAAQRFLGHEERTLIVYFSLEWPGLPRDTLPEWAHIGVGGSLRQQYLQPTFAKETLGPGLVAGVAGPVLDYLERPTSRPGPTAHRGRPGRRRCGMDEAVPRAPRAADRAHRPVLAGAARRTASSAAGWSDPWGPTVIRDLLNRYRPAVPDPEDIVMTSTEVLDHRLVVTRLHRFTGGGWMALAAQEAEESEPTWVHFAHVLQADPTVATAPPLKRGQYALRHPQLSRWTIFGPVGDLALDAMLDNGTIDRQHEALIARDHPQ